MEEGKRSGSFPRCEILHWDTANGRQLGTSAERPLICSITQCLPTLCEEEEKGKEHHPQDGEHHKTKKKAPFAE